MTAAQRANQISAAAAADFNDELTIILTATMKLIRMLEPDDPMKPLLNSVLESGYRLTYKAHGLLVSSARAGAKPSPTTLEALFEQ